MTRIDRRTFLGSTAALPLLPGPAVAGVLDWVPEGDPRTLIVLELDGGNDGLNTVLPADRSSWARARPRLSAVRNGAPELAGGFALHPGLAGVHRLVRDGLAAVVHGVGYPDSSRSHFKSRDVWHTADVGFQELRADSTGWLGRAADQLARRSRDSVPALSVGSLQVPLILKARDLVVPSVNRIEEYQLLAAGGAGDEPGRRRELSGVVDSGSRGDADDLRAYLGGVARSAVQNAERLRSSLAGYRAKAEFPATALGRKLALLSRIVVSGFGTRLFHVNFPGFDTHANQLPAHAALLRQFAQAIEALILDLKAHRTLDRVLVMVQSEFGRRVAENRSRGTDHGMAGPMFFFGGGVRPGLHGEHPSLTDLREGDLRPTADFRALYAAALRWLRLDPKGVLGHDHRGPDPLT